MKGFQLDKIILQKVNRNKKEREMIRIFEQNKYLIDSNESIWKYQFPLQECFNLQNLIDSLNPTRPNTQESYRYIVIYKAQMILIIKEVLNHLQSMHFMNLRHGNLDLKNIFISLKQMDKQKNKLTVYQVQITIDKVYFINYQLLSNEDYKHDELQDVKQMQQNIQKLLSIYKECNLMEQLLNDIENININQDSLNQIVYQIDQFILKNVDQKNQQLKQNEIKTIGYLTTRYTSEGVLLKAIEELNDWNFDYVFKIRDDTGNRQDIEQSRIQETVVVQENLTQQQEQIQQQIKISFLETIIKQFWRYFGEKLEKNTLGVSQQDRQQWQLRLENNKTFILSKINQIEECLQRCLNYQKVIEEQIDEEFKGVDYSNKINVKDIYYKYLQIRLFGIDFYDCDLNKITKELEDQIKKEISNYYYCQIIIFGVQLSNELI